MAIPVDLRIKKTYRALFDAFHFQSGIGDALSDLLDGQIAEIHILT